MTHYAETGVQSVLVKNLLYTNQKPDYPNIKLKLILNRTGRIDTFQHYAGNDIKYYKAFQYNQKGLITRELTLKPNKDTARYEVNVYDQNNLISNTTFNHQNQRIFQELFAYNQSQHLTEHTKINHKQDTSQYQIKYQYNPAGQITLKSRQDQQKQDITTWYYSYLDSGRTTLIKTDHGIFGQIPVSSETKDTQGHVISQKFYNQEGQLVTEHIYTYSKNNLIQEQIFDTQSETEFIITRKFNRKHQLKEEMAKYKFDSDLHHHYKLFYNCKGLVKKEKIYPGNGKPPKLIKSVYDKQQNCVTEIHFQDKEVFREVQYIIQYFPEN